MVFSFISKLITKLLSYTYRKAVSILTWPIRILIDVVKGAVERALAVIILLVMIALIIIYAVSPGHIVDYISPLTDILS
jgi:hypothetical protein